MCKEREEDVEGDTTEEDGEHGHPFEILDKGAEETLFTQTIAQDCQADVSCSREDDQESDEDTPGLNVEFVNVTVIPANKEVIEERERETEANGVVGCNVAEDGELGGHLHVGPEETAEERGERTLPWPFVHWVEDKFVAAVGISFGLLVKM